MRHGAQPIRVWIDIENPPQVQYLSPFKERFEELGVQVVVTAKDNSIAHELLRQRGIEFVSVGVRLRKAKLRKVAGVLARAHALTRLFKESERPDLALSASRPSAIAARRLGIPAFVIDDYEHADARLYGWMRCWLLHPDVIPAEAFERQGVRADRLIPMRGLKEDISFARVDLAAAPAFAGPTPQPGVSRILFRPPAEESHYYDERSKSLADALLRHLSAREDVSVLYAPRYEWQGDELAAYEWKHEPTRLGSAVQFVSLLKSVDAVVSSGGTMVREAAYVGIPAYSILRSRIGAVDRYLESLGRLRVVESASDFAQLQFSRVKGFSRLEDNPNLLDEVVEEILRRSAVGRVSPAGAFAPAESRMTAGSRP